METTAQFTAVAHGGHGICRIDGQVCFTPYALPGDTARIRIARQTRGVLWGELVEVVEASPHRHEAACPYFGRCGGCTWLHFAYPAQADWKRQIVQDSLQRLGGLTIDVQWVEDPALREGYRTRAEFHTQTGRLGFYERASHEVVHVGQCLLCHTRLNAVLEPLRAARPRASVEITVNPEGDDILLHQPEVTNGSVEPRLADAFPDAVGPRQFLFDGLPVVNAAFSQSGLQLNRMLRKVVADLAGEPATVLDLYCGSGNFSLGFDSAKTILGLDHNEPAVRAAQETATARNLPARYEAAGETSFRGALGQPWDLVILDPPRTGARDIIPHLAAANARTILYVSCDPATLARDLRALTAGPWRLTHATAVDMFPNTAHVETVCRLEHTA